MATPVGRNVGKPFPAVWDTMVDLFVVWIRLIIRLADALRDNLWIALPMTSILAVDTLHTGCVLQEVAAKGTPHDVVELLRDELVALFLDNLLLLLTDGSLAIEPKVERPPVTRVFDYRMH